VIRAIDVSLTLDRNDLAALADRMREPWLDGAWVSVRSADPQTIDALVLEACLELGNGVRAQVTALPPVTGSDAIDRVVDAIAGGACRAVRVAPGARGHRYPLADWVLTPLPEVCDREGLALAVDWGGSEHIAWQEVVSFARAYPGLPLVLVGADLELDRAIPAALECAPNLVIELSALATVAPLAQLAARVGQHRFVYGSGGRADSGLLGAIREGDGLDDSTRTAVLAANADALGSGRWAAEFL
jgi:hypothetical protein